MKKELALIFGLFLTIGFVLALPSSPHAFYGKIEYNNETILGSCSIEVKLNDFTEQCLIIEGKYGYDSNTCIALDENNLGGNIEFYIEDKKIGETQFIDKEITELDFAIDFLPNCPIISSCGDGIIQSGETCDDSNTVNGDGCSSTCAIESKPSSGGGSSGGGGGGGGGSNGGSTSGVVHTSTQDDDDFIPSGNDDSDQDDALNSDIVRLSNEKRDNPRSSRITGSVIGALGNTAGVFLIIFFIIGIVGASVVMRFVKKRENGKKK